MQRVMVTFQSLISSKTVLSDVLNAKHILIHPSNLLKTEESVYVTCALLKLKFLIIIIVP